MNYMWLRADWVDCNAKMLPSLQRYTYRVLQTIQIKLILLCVWAEPAILESAKTALKFKYDIQMCQQIYNSMFGAGYKLEKWSE